MTSFLPLSLTQELANIEEHWQPIIHNWGDFEFRFVKFQGEFGWHTHDTDKVLLVSSGEMYIDFEQAESIKIAQGELYVVPKQIAHQPRSDAECAIVLIEASNADTIS